MSLLLQEKVCVTGTCHQTESLSHKLHTLNQTACGGVGVGVVKHGNWIWRE